MVSINEWKLRQKITILQKKIYNLKDELHEEKKKKSCFLWFKNLIF